MATTSPVALEPPLRCLPDYIEPDTLQAYRASYRQFRRGRAKGAKGEVGSVSASTEELLMGGFETFMGRATSVDWAHRDVTFSLAFENLDRARLEAVAPVRRIFLARLKEAIALEAGSGIESEHVTLVLAAGLATVHATLAPPSGVSAEEVLFALASSTDLGRAIGRHLDSVDGIEAVATGPLRVADVSVPRAAHRAGKLASHHSTRRAGQYIPPLPCRAHLRRRQCCGFGAPSGLGDRLIEWILGEKCKQEWLAGDLLSQLAEGLGALLGVTLEGIRGLSKLPAMLTDSDLGSDSCFLTSRRAEIEYDVDCLEHVGVLGCGSFGRVSLVRCTKTLNYFALKALSKGMILQTKMYHCLKTETRVMSESCSPFIIQLVASFSRPQHIFLLMEPAMGGDLFTAYRRYGLFGLESHARFYFACAMRALEHLHQLSVIYRDLKMENVVLDARGYGKLCDFGMARVVTWPFRAYTMCGTLEYLAPEILIGTGYSYAIDWWALGVLLCEVLTGEVPFDGVSPPEVHKKMLDGMDNVIFLSDGPWTQLARGLCRLTPGDRLPMLDGGIEKVESHPWFLAGDFDWEAHRRLQMQAPHEPELDSEVDLRNFDLTEQVPPPHVFYDGADGLDWELDFEAPLGPASCEV